MRKLLPVPHHLNKWAVLAAWLLCLAVITTLGMVRFVTDAEYTFASISLIPVLIITWIAGKKSGLILAIYASLMWLGADFFSDRQFSTAWIPWINAITRLLTYTLLVLLLDKVQTLLLEEHLKAINDGLTGLSNRNRFLLEGESEVERSKRYSRHMAIIYLDLDFFKELNDTKGHDQGDQALKATAEALRISSRKSDLAARLGGDEFAVLLPEIDFGDAKEVGQKIFRNIDNALSGFPPARASVGVVWFEKPEHPFSEMLNAADQLMYEVKKHGKNNIAFRKL